MIEFNRDNAEKINSLCAPLKDHFGITAFGYLLAFDDGQYILISNNDSYLEAVAGNDCCFRSEYFAKQAELFCRYESCLDIWPDQIQDEAIELYRGRGLYNGFSIAQEAGGAVEGCWFSNGESHSHIKEFYRKHYTVLEDFITRFRTIGGSLTDPTGPAKLGISPHLKKTYPKIENIFKNTTPWERKIIEFNGSMDNLVKQGIYETGRRYALTMREIECLSYLTTGKTAKEIARLINVAPRTVEAHISNIRFKTGCHTKRDLNQWFEETFRPFLGVKKMNGLM